MDTSDFNFIFLGQSVLKYKVPLDVFHTINDIYEKRRHELYPANKQLVGKIENEHSLFFDGLLIIKCNLIDIYQRILCNGSGKDLNII